jgi:F-type H+-transporting ATPase subunit epsilon
MSKTFHIKIVTPESILFEGEVVSMTIPTDAGEITVLPNHIPIVSTISSGVAVITYEDGHDEDLAISGGFLQVKADHQVVVLAEMAERAINLDIQAIEEAKARAEKTMSEQVRASDEEYAETTAILNRELARYKAVLKHRTRHDHAPNPLSE